MEVMPIFFMGHVFVNWDEKWERKVFVGKWEKKRVEIVENESFCMLEEIYENFVMKLEHQKVRNRVELFAGQQIFKEHLSFL